MRATYPIPVGATFEVHTEDGKVMGRIVHLGNGRCNSERRTTKGNWQISRTDMQLNREQLGEWLKRMTGEATVFSAMCALPMDD